MKKFFRQQVIPQLDKATIAREPISSVDLMERAAWQVRSWIIKNCQNQEIIIFAGPGNNGGDGLAVARMLYDFYNETENRSIRVYTYSGHNGNRSADCETNLHRLADVNIEVVENDFSPNIMPNSLIVDALFGTGLSRPVEGDLANVISQINASNCEVLSIDIPSGLGDEDSYAESEQRSIVHARWTISFQFPKLFMMLPELAKYAGKVSFVNIDLLQSAIDEQDTELYYFDEDCARALISPRNHFAHKGDFGRTQIFAGSYGMMGAAVMATSSCVKSGAGLVTAVIPRVGYDIMQISVPEAMVKASEGEEILLWNSQFIDNSVDAIGAGPGIGRTYDSYYMVKEVINAYREHVPMVIDADALFHLARLIKEDNFKMPKNCILTPHDIEFDRLTESHSTRQERIFAAQKFAQQYSVTIVLKGAYTAVVLPDGRISFNMSGNVGMATGGSGDVLTGIITALLAQGYSTEEAATLGVFVHGFAGDLACEKYSEISMSATDIIKMLGKAFRILG